MTILHRVAGFAVLALAAFLSARAEAGVTYVFQPLTLERSLNSYTQVPLPFSGPIGSMTITDEAYALRRVDSYLDIESFFFNSPDGVVAIRNLTPCQLPTVTGNCSKSSSTIAMRLSEDGEIESGGITYYGGYYLGLDQSYFANDRILTMSGSDGDWTGRQVGETGSCNINPGCLFTGEWVPIPEPASAALFGTGLGAALWLRRRRPAA